MANTGKDAAGSTIYLRKAFGTGVDDTNAYTFGSAVYFSRNGVEQLCVLDTGTAANNRPFPVLALSADGAAPFDTNSGAAGATTIRSVLATRHEAAPTPIAVRLSDGSAFYTGQYTEDGISAGGESLTLAGAIRRDLPASSSGTAGDYSNINTDAKGSLWVNASSAPVNLSAQDVFGSVKTGQQNNQIDVQFYRDTPSAVMTITTANSGTVTQSIGGALFASSTNTSGSAKGVAFTNVTYRAGAEVYCYFSASFTAGVSSSYMRYGIYDTNNGAFIGYEGTTFSATVRNNASDSNTTAKASWNVDTLTGAANSKFTRGGVPEAINLTFVNVWRIRFGWVGGAQVNFEVLSPDGEWVLFHQVRHPNTANSFSMRTGDLPVTIDISKTTAGANDLQILTGCCAAGTTYQSADISFDGAGSQTSSGNNIINEVAGTGSTDCYQYRSIALQINVASGTVTAGAITFEASTDNVNWVATPLYDIADPSVPPVTTYNPAASTPRYFVGPLYYRYFRARISQGVTGTTTGLQCFTTLRIIPFAHPSRATRGALGHDAVDTTANFPVKIGARALSTVETTTLVASGDVSHLVSDLDGSLVIRSQTSLGDLVSDRVADTGGTSTAFTNLGAGGSGIRNYLTTLHVYNSSTTNGFVDIRDGTGGSVIWTIGAPAQSGAVITFNPPLRQPTTNTALAYDVSAAISTVYISAAGFQSKCG